MKQSSPARKQITETGERATPTRVAVLEILLASGEALTHHEIEQAITARGSAIDRVTLYRVLDWLVQQELAHKIASEDRLWRFSTVADSSRSHAHFHCTHCGKVFCLEEIEPAVAAHLPRGFSYERVEMTLEGACPTCRP